ncbi:beta-lactamase hydrolase domain-containing protein [Acinetobacter piscicola]|uniref:beta-lactamase hydrolase domain-containing protein n=1 Tax=Acinetobacter piscicola TaxID=2006115 RepID=UPI0035585D7A
MTKKQFTFWIVFLCFSISNTFAETLFDRTTLTPSVSVAGKMTIDKFQVLLTQGFKSVIVNRPDNEMGNLVTASQLRQISEKSQVSLIYQPVISGKISQQDVIEFSKYYNSLPKPILMICKSGSRSTSLFNQAKEAGLLHE